jgi:prevent-host-death family protein
MKALPELVPITDLRQDAAAVLDAVRTARQPVVITQRGRAAAVLLSIDAYERGEREKQLLRALARGEKEIAAGLSFGLDEVMAEADALLARARP